MKGNGGRDASTAQRPEGEEHGKDQGTPFTGR